MKFKKLLFIALALIGIGSFAQNKESKFEVTKISVKSLKIETDDFQELKDFDWKGVKDMFEENSPEEEITLSIQYNQPEDGISEGINNWSSSFTSKNKNLDAMISKIQKIIINLDKVNSNSE